MAGADLAVGVDGGNTKTIALLCDVEGRALGIGRGGSSNWEMQGQEQAAAVIIAIIEQAISMSGTKRKDVLHAHMGLAGVDWPEDEPRMRTALVAAGWQAGLTLENDAFSALRACAPEGYGVAVTAGTGVASGIVMPDGTKYFYGAYTDLGGGFDAAAQALRAVIRADDGRGQPTALTQAVLEKSGYASAHDLVYAMHRGRKSVPRAVLDRVLYATAGRGDAVAVEIVTRFGRELALCATNLIRRHRLTEADPAVVASGSLFMKTGPLLFEVFRGEVLAVAPRARVVLADQPPVMGAVRGALSACGRGEPEVWVRVNQEVAEKGWLREESGQAATRAT